MNLSRLRATHYPCDESGFYHTPVLIAGARDAVLVDGVFRFSQGAALAEAIRATGRRLSTVYVSCNDPDFYFGLRPVLQAFPEARVIAAAETVAAIEANVDEKLAVWAPALQDDGPGRRADVVIPQASDAEVLSIEGEPIRIIAVSGMHDRRFLWVPCLQGVFGGTLVVSGIHVWMADTPSPAEVAAWLAALDTIAALDPRTVIPGPGLAGCPYLELGAKVVMGEMSWGKPREAIPGASSGT